MLFSTIDLASDGTGDFNVGAPSVAGQNKVEKCMKILTFVGIGE